MIPLVNSRKLSKNAVIDDVKRSRKAALQILLVAITSVESQLVVKNQFHRKV